MLDRHEGEAEPSRRQSHDLRKFIYRFLYDHLGAIQVLRNAF